MTTSAPPVRRATSRGVPSAAPPPRVVASAMTPTSIKATHTTKTSTSSLQRSSRTPSRETHEDSFNGALYSLKAFSIATAFVVAGGAASVWGVKTYLGVRDVRFFLSHTVGTLTPHVDTGIRFRDAPHAPHQVAAPRLAHTSRV